MRRRLHALAWVGLLGGIFFASCLARRDKPFVRQTDDDAGPPDSIALDGAAPDVSPDALEIAPHAVLGIDPPHGPFAGNTLVMIRGNGFESNARVWFGDVEVPKASVTPVDPQRIQVVTPPGHAGAVDLRVQNGNAESTSATLTGGYTYDTFFATPSSGPTSGGTIITIEGDGVSWDDSTEVEIDRQPCTDVSILSPTKLACTTPPSDAGSKVLSVISGDQREDVLDGFTYGNGDDGFKGGLSGQPLGKQLTVLAFDNQVGAAIPGVTVLLGDDVDSGQVAHTDKNGVATFSGELGRKGTVTLAVKCFEPITFFDVPVDHLFATPVMIDYFDDLRGEGVTVVSPDAGGVERARAFAKRMGAPLAIIDKRRTDVNVAEVMHIIGEVEGQNCLIVDDLIDTAGTLVKGSEALLKAGAKSVSACATHAVLSGPAVERIENSEIEEVIVTNSIPLGDHVDACRRIKVLSVAPLLAKAIQSIHEDGSVSTLFV